MPTGVFGTTVLKTAFVIRRSSCKQHSRWTRASCRDQISATRRRAGKVAADGHGERNGIDRRNYRDIGGANLTPLGPWI